MPRFLDLTGKVYGEFTVIEMLRNYKNKGKTYCKCLGVDGIEYIIRQDALQSGATKHIKGATKAGRINDITGKRFGKLRVLYPTEKRAANNGIVWKCLCDCGNLTTSTSSNLSRGHTTSCGCKKSSIAEGYIIRHLKSRNIVYEKEKTFEGLRNPKGNMNLYFDFYFPEINTIVEYDGELHYISIEFFGGEERLRYYQKCDEIKNQYCKDHNINLIRIPYTKTDKEVVQILDSVICP